MPPASKPHANTVLGVIEPQVADRMRSMPNPTIAGEYFARQAGRVHLFQQRIPIQTAR